MQRWNLPAGWVISARPAHPAIVSEADYIAAQDASAPRGPAGPATRRYLLAGLLVCGGCGRRLESAWSNGKPAYRCRHGYTSATGPEPGRPKNLYVREDQILPHLAAMAILLDGRPRPRTRPGAAQLTAPAQAAGLIDRLRAEGVALVYDPAARALRTGGEDPVTVTVSQGCCDYRAISIRRPADRGTPPTRRDSRATAHDQTLKISDQPSPQTATSRSRNIEVNAS